MLHISTTPRVKGVSTELLDTHYCPRSINTHINRFLLWRAPDPIMPGNDGDATGEETVWKSSIGFYR